MNNMNNMNNQSQLGVLHGIFPCPVYIVKRDSELSSKEDKDIEDIIKEGMKNQKSGNATSVNSYIFNSKLKEIKQFCEQQIKIYVEKVILPVGELDCYITQSWLNITKPGEWHHQHCHPNSIISGVFYISTEESDRIAFIDPNTKIKQVMSFRPKKYNMFNSFIWGSTVNTNELILFPSWLEHCVESNEKATTDRISLSFNTFVKGTFGTDEGKTELILK
jgi:uncharacterized protein (TIGR02466 family)